MSVECFLVLVFEGLLIITHLVKCEASDIRVGGQFVAFY